MIDRPTNTPRLSFVTDQAARQTAASLVLSLFPGIDLLGRGFEDEGFCVVRGPDLIWGQAIESFHVPSGRFDGVIAGTPCQDFSTINRNRDRARGEALLEEFRRVVTEAHPEWWLLENVPSVPDVSIPDYTTQRLDLRGTECGMKQRRLRHFQFGSRDGSVLIPKRDPLQLDSGGRLTEEACCLASEGARRIHKRGETVTRRRNFADFCELQGLPRDFDLPGWSLEFKYRAVGNGVPIPMARVVAIAVKLRIVTGGAESPKLCECNCGRIPPGRKRQATTACRKRTQRRRDRAR